MARHVLFRGTSPNDGAGEQLYGATLFLNDMFEELYALQSDTINAGAVVYAAATSEARIQLAINDAVLLGKSRVYIPSQYLPYDASLIAFNGAVQMVWEGGDFSLFDIRAYGAAGDGAQDDAIAIQRAIDGAAVFLGVGGGQVYLPAGIYKMNSPLVVATSSGISIRGAGYLSRLVAGAAMTNMLTFSVPGVRGSRGFIRDILVRGQGLADWAFKLDSWHGFDVRGIEAEDVLQGLIDITTDQSTFTELVTVEHCDVRMGAAATQSNGFARVRAGAAGMCSEIVFRDCMCLSLKTGWGIELDDVQRCVVDGFVAANNTDNFAGGVLVRESNTAAGATDETGAHWINKVYIENNAGGGSAICVQVQADAAATRLLRNVRVTHSHITPETRTHLKLVNNSGVNGRVANISFAYPTQVIGQANNIVIGTNCVNTKLYIPGGNNAIATGVTDNGSRTAINQVRQEALGAGVTPSASTSGDVGEITRNTSDGTLYIDDISGAYRLLWGVRVVSPAALGAGNNNNWTGADNAETARVSCNAAGSTITGIANGVLGAAGSGRRLRIVNVSANTLTITNQDAASTAANQIITGTGANLTFAQDKALLMEYDNTTARWRVVATS